MRSTQGAAGNGFGFSWPASFPMARIDQIMVKGVEPVTLVDPARDRQRPPAGRGAREISTGPDLRVRALHDVVDSVETGASSSRNTGP